MSDTKELIKKVVELVGNDNIGSSLADFLSTDWLNLHYVVKYRDLAVSRYGFNEYVNDLLSDISEGNRKTLLEEYETALILKSVDYNSWKKYIEESQGYKRVLEIYEARACFKVLEEIYNYHISNLENVELPSYFKLIDSSVSFKKVASFHSHCRSVNASTFDALYRSRVALTEIYVKKKAEKDGFEVKEGFVNLGEDGFVFYVKKSGSDKWNVVKYTDGVEKIDIDYEKLFSIILPVHLSEAENVVKSLEGNAFDLIKEIEGGQLVNKLELFYQSGKSIDIIENIKAKISEHDFDVMENNLNYALYATNFDYSDLASKVKDSLYQSFIPLYDQIAEDYGNTSTTFTFFSLILNIQDKLSSDINVVGDYFGYDFKLVSDFNELIYIPGGCKMFKVGEFANIFKLISPKVNNSINGISRDSESEVESFKLEHKHIYPFKKYSDMLSQMVYISPDGKKLFYLLKKDGQCYFAEYVGKVEVATDINFEEAIIVEPVAYDSWLVETSKLALTK